MKESKIMLPKTIRFLFSSSIVSIVISICLLVTLFSPGLSLISKNGNDTFPCEQHTCGCKSAPDCLNHCCCTKETNTSALKCLLKEGPKGTLSTFIQSLACAGVPDQFVAILYNISLPEDGVLFPNLYRFYCIKTPQTVFPTSINISLPDKPPRIT